MHLDDEDNQTSTFPINPLLRGRRIDFVEDKSPGSTENRTQPSISTSRRIHVRNANTRSARFVVKISAKEEAIRAARIAHNKLTIPTD